MSILVKFFSLSFFLYSGVVFSQSEQCVPEEFSTVTYYCSNYRNLNISTINANYEEQRGVMTLDSYNQCEEMSLVLNTHKWRVSERTLVAVCDYRDMHRRMIEADGSIVSLSTVVNASSNECEELARAINTASE